MATPHKIWQWLISSFHLWFSYAEGISLKLKYSLVWSDFQCFQVALLTITEHAQTYNTKGKVNALYIWISTKCVIHFIISVTEVIVSNTSAVNVWSSCLSTESYRVKNVPKKKARIRFVNSDYLDSNSSLSTRLWCWNNNKNTGSKWILLSGRQASLLL